MIHSLDANTYFMEWNKEFWVELIKLTLQKVACFSKVCSYIICRPMY
jgi:hypothetical protein